MTKQFPLYTSAGDWAGVISDGYLYNSKGDWVGWVERDSNVYSVGGEYIGWLNKDFRILRKRSLDKIPPRHRPPVRPPLKITLPSNMPLAPLMSDLSYDTVDVLEEQPDLLYTVDNDPTARDIGE